MSSTDTMPTIIVELRVPHADADFIHLVTDPERIAAADEEDDDHDR